MRYRITKPEHVLKGEISLPSSKSVTNRLLIIRALTKEPFVINNISDSDDTNVLLNAIETVNSKISNTIDVGPAGTSMRFLTAYLSRSNSEYILTGSERMKNRPISKLVDALRAMGAQIEYLEKGGFPPLKITGCDLQGGEVLVDSSISSQFTSALLMIAPTLPKGLILKMRNKMVSSSYIWLTLKLMENFGVKYTWTGETIEIPSQKYVAKDVTVEGDWSAASYWYEMAALADDADFVIRGLFNNSMQGDARIAELFDSIGVGTEYIEGGIKLYKKKISCKFFEYDFIENPDMVQTFAVTLCNLGIPFKFTGTESLKIKETDRIEAVIAELKKLGFKLESPNPDILSWDGNYEIKRQTVEIETYDDHRMAMAFAPAAIKHDLVIHEPLVVNKSYPCFWLDLKKAGFEIQNYIPGNL